MLSQDVPVRLDILQDGRRRRLAVPGRARRRRRTRSTGTATANGAVLPDGRYVAVFTVTDALGDVQIAVPVTIDTVAPTLTLVDPLDADASRSTSRRP